MSKTIEIPTISINSIRSTVSKALNSAADTIDNAKTPSLKEIRSAVGKGVKKARHNVAQFIDVTDEK